jgi:hypothetical protein
MHRLDLDFGGIEMGLAGRDLHTAWTKQRQLALRLRTIVRQRISSGETSKYNVKRTFLSGSRSCQLLTDLLQHRPCVCKINKRPLSGAWQIKSEVQSPKSALHAILYQHIKPHFRILSYYLFLITSPSQIRVSSTRSLFTQILDGDSVRSGDVFM